MEQKEIYFKDSFFSSGETEIYTQDKEQIGYLDLGSMMTSSMTVYNLDREPLIRGNFRFLSNKWLITNTQEESEIGLVRARFSFFEKKFEYEAYGRGVYTISSPAFSRDYTILDVDNNEVATFSKVNDFFAAAAYRLINYSSKLTWLELIAVIMGVNEIQKRRRRAAQSSNCFESKRGERI